MIHKVPVEHYFVVDGVRHEPIEPRWDYSADGLNFWGKLEVGEGMEIESVVMTPFGVERRLTITMPKCGLLDLRHTIEGFVLDDGHTRVEFEDGPLPYNGPRL